ncbi:MAG TPA: efflux RND transporter periplasmic adaptor subunit [Tepidisphaeraceae bacterium]|nr:efflux RND transporter periplasmic adaptor subunit [Tepidisphaeraceae bacterium]
MDRRRAQSTAKWIFIAAVVTACAVAAGYMALRLARPIVTVSEAVEAPVVQAFYSTGTVQPEREYPVKSNVAGIITEVRVDKGDRVKKGDALAIVSVPELKYAADKARAELIERQKRADPKTSPVLREYEARISAAQDILEIAQREEKRVSQLVARNAASQTDLDKALDRLKVAWGDLESWKAQRAAKQLELERELQVAQAAVATAEWNLQQQTLRAPVDGVVLDRPTALGTRVAINDPLMRIADVTPANLVMRAAVDEEDVTKVHHRQDVRMTLYSFPGQILEGTVTRIYDQADEARRTFEVDVRLTERTDRLAPGMTGELAFIMDAKEKAIAIPAQAVQAGALFGVRDGKVVQFDAQIGLRSVERVEVLKGVAPGDRVIISPIGELSEGKPVRTRYVDPATAAGLNKPEVVDDSFKGFQ